MKNRTSLIFVALAAVFVFAIIVTLLKKPATAPTLGKGDLIFVTYPKSGDTVASPLVVRGQARGPWFFEATFPITLLDEQGKTITTGRATAEGDWTTTIFVPFSETLAFTAPATPTGTLVLSKANPSGLPEHADELRVPVQFGKRP